jgi:hypothetical protein
MQIGMILKHGQINLNFYYMKKFLSIIAFVSLISVKSHAQYLIDTIINHESNYWVRHSMNQCINKVNRTNFTYTKYGEALNSVSLVNIDKLPIFCYQDSSYVINAYFAVSPSSNSGVRFSFSDMSATNVQLWTNTTSLAAFSFQYFNSGESTNVCSAVLNFPVHILITFTAPSTGYYYIMLRSVTAAHEIDLLAGSYIEYFTFTIPE